MDFDDLFANDVKNISIPKVYRRRKYFCIKCVPFEYPKFARKIIQVYKKNTRSILVTQPICIRPTTRHQSADLGTLVLLHTGLLDAAIKCDHKLRTRIIIHFILHGRTFRVAAWLATLGHSLAQLVLERLATR